MTASEQRNSSSSSSQTHQEDARPLPGVFLLLKDAAEVTWRLRSPLYGYVAWLLIPTVAAIFALNLPSPEQEFVILLTEAARLALSIWATAAMVLYVTMNTVKADDEEIVLATLGKRAWDRALPLFTTQLLMLVLVLAGLFGLILPGVFIWGWTAFAPYDVILSTKGPIESLKYSFTIVRGRFLQVLWRLVLGNGLLSIAVLGCFQAYLTTGIPLENPWSDIALSLIILPFLPLIILFHLLLYFALKTSYAAREKPLQGDV